MKVQSKRKEDTTGNICLMPSILFQEQAKITSLLVNKECHIASNSDVKKVLIGCYVALKLVVVALKLIYG